MKENEEEIEGATGLREFTGAKKVEIAIKKPESENLLSGIIQSKNR